MTHFPGWRPVLALITGIMLLLVVVVDDAAPYSSLFTSRCASCHNDDSPTCIGCHRHKGTLHATADQAEYAPGQPVTIILNGGGMSGWMRALLYDDLNQELTRLTGPTGSGDDGLGNPVRFPAELVATAPIQAGDYVWEAAWFGGNTSGTGHLEVRTPVTIHVVGSTAVGEGETPSTWGRIKALYER